MFIEMEQQLITMFDCEFYNTMIDMDFPVNDMHVNIHVNQKNHAIYITITSEDDVVNETYKFGIINMCPDINKRYICTENQCMSDKFYSIKINSTLPNLDKMISYVLTVENNEYYKYFI
jgi:hypothetical protein